MTAPTDWPKPFKILCANVGQYSGDWGQMVSDFEDTLAEWTDAGFRLYAGGFHPDDRVFWALMVKVKSEPV